ncbi:MAG: zinc ribbon domain-containing protein [Planctomycetota bacterium]
MPIEVLYALGWASVWTILGVFVGMGKNRILSGVVWSLLLGPIGVIIVAALPRLPSDEEKAQAIKDAEVTQKREAAAEQAKVREGMVCVSCEAPLKPGMKFCPECGAAQVTACHACGAEMSMSAKFCGECGAPRKNGAPPSLKTV